MNRKIFLPMVALGILAFGLALRAGAPKTETVSYKSGDETVSGYLALPDGAGKHPAIIVIHEWWGLNDWVKEQAQKYAAIRDMWRWRWTSIAERWPTNPDDAHIELIRGLPDDRAAARPGSGVCVSLFASGREYRQDRIDRMVHGRRLVP